MERALQRPGNEPRCDSRSPECKLSSLNKIRIAIANRKVTRSTGKAVYVPSTDPARNSRKTHIRCRDSNGKFAMGDVVIDGYKPKRGKEDELLGLVREHVPYLRKLGLATDRAPIALKSRDGIVVEIFEWCDGAVEQAHSNPAVQKLWDEYVKVCDYVPLVGLSEFSDMFAQFVPID